MKARIRNGLLSVGFLALAADMVAVKGFGLDTETTPNYILLGMFFFGIVAGAALMSPHSNEEASNRQTVQSERTKAKGQGAGN